MRTTIIPVTVFCCFVLSSTATAEPWDTVCSAAVEQLAKQQKAIQPRVLEVERAHQGRTVGFAELTVCYPGGQFSARKAQDCVTAQREVPLKVRAVVEAEADLNVAIRGFEERVHDMVRVCLDGH